MLQRAKMSMVTMLKRRRCSIAAVLGDIAYPAGSYTDFLGCFDPAWGRHKERIRPVPGNHEYGTPGAGGYYAYFGATASPLEPGCIVNCKGYYSYKLGSWHIVALNSEVEMAAGSEQESWLRADLAANRTLCTLAYWRHPRFSSGGHGTDERSAAVWQALYEVGVDVVLNGHDHDYERFAPQNPAGELETARVIREFVVGTGGAPLHGFERFQDNSEASNSESWGVLQLSLYPDHYEWAFRAVDGETFVDSGSTPCVSVVGDWGSQIYFPWIGSLPTQ
jgi:acid phosphatase type 7